MAATYRTSIVSGSQKLSVVLFEEPPDSGIWVAASLEKDIAGHGPTLALALDALRLLVDATVQFDLEHNRPALALLEPAPQRYWELKESPDCLDLLMVRN